MMTVTMMKDDGLLHDRDAADADSERPSPESTTAA